MGTVSNTLKLTLEFAVLQEDPATIEKDFVPITPFVECYPYGELNVLSPNFKFKYDDTTTRGLYKNCNYFRVAEWNRYYFMSPPTYDSGICYISGQEDVLMTFKNEILTQPFILSRVEQRSFANMYYPDNQQIPICAAWTTTENFPIGFNESWVLGSTGALVQAI